MKTLNSIKYILLALIVLGFFANFAQNEYGLDIVFFSLIGFTAIFLTEAIYYGLIVKKVPDLKKNEYSHAIRILVKIILILLAVAITSLCIAGIIVSENNVFEDIAGFTFGLAFILLIPLFILAFDERSFIREPISLTLFCLGFIFKYLHYPGSAFLILISSLLLLIYFISQAIFQYRNLKKENKFLAFFVFVFFLMLSSSILSIVFVMQRYPGSSYISAIVLVLTFIVLIPVVIQKKFIDKDQKITLWSKIRQIKGNCTLLFLFYTLATLWWALMMFEITPKIYSERFPLAHQKLRDASHVNEQIYYYEWGAFWDNREKFEKEQEGNK